ncbi:MAG: ChbG/HpnK family deacetylase [Cyanobacteriota bacterium]
MKVERRCRPTPVVINADDFGYGSEVNAAIYAAGRQRCISSATIMANGPALSEALAMKPDLPEMSFGIHLNLTEFSPLLPVSALKSAGLLNANGTFLGSEFRQLRPSPRLLEACYEELNQQLHHLHQKGLRPSHFDSHHHIHTIPWLLPVVWQLQKKYKIFRLRNTLNIYPAGEINTARLRLLAAKKIWQSATFLLGSKMPQRFSSLHVFMADPHRPDFSTASSLELMCHPGQAGFEAETQELLKRGASVLPAGFALLNYYELLTA